MPRDKSESHIRVNQAIREEFLSKGFEGASIREIGKKAGMTSAGLYRHYADKDMMFDSVVKPLIDEIDAWFEHHKESKYDLVSKNAEKDALIGESAVDLIKEVILPKKQEFKLLLTGAKGSKYENFVHDFVEKGQKEILVAISCMKESGYPAADIEEEELHVLLSAYITAMLETIVHDYNDDRIRKYLDRINEFFMPGWLKIMGLS